MNKFALILSGFALFATAATAQETQAPSIDLGGDVGSFGTSEDFQYGVTPSVDCSDEANKDDADCTVLPGVDDVQNLAVLGPLIGGGGLAAAGFFSPDPTTSTTNTTSTTSTAN